MPRSRAKKMASANIEISIIIPARNEGANIGPCLDAVAAQAGPHDVEVIVIDSGSSDNTIAVVQARPDVRLVRIRPEDFGHGRTRNLGAGLARGDFLVFLNADAVPGDRQWLSGLIGEFASDRSVAGVFSRHLPKSGCHLYMARDLETAMPALRMERSRAGRLDFFLFSTVSAAIRKEIWSAIPFADDIPIAEDQDWAEKVLQRGFKLVYAPASVVRHSHNYSPAELFRLKCLVGRTERRFLRKLSALFAGFILALSGMVFKFFGDSLYVMRSGLPLKTKLREICVSLGARTASFTGRYVGWVKGAGRTPSSPIR